MKIDKYVIGILGKPIEKINIDHDRMSVDIGTHFVDDMNAFADEDSKVIPINQKRFKLSVNKKWEKMERDLWYPFQYVREKKNNNRNIDSVYVF